MTVPGALQPQGIRQSLALSPLTEATASAYVFIVSGDVSAHSVALTLIGITSSTAQVRQRGVACVCRWCPMVEGVLCIRAMSQTDRQTNKPPARRTMTVFRFDATRKPAYYSPLPFAPASQTQSVNVWRLLTTTITVPDVPAAQMSIQIRSFTENPVVFYVDDVSVMGVSMSASPPPSSSSPPPPPPPPPPSQGEKKKKIECRLVRRAEMAAWLWIRSEN